MNTEFEQYARNQFNQHKIALDVESLWEDVYPQVKEEKKKRRFFWIFLFGLAIGAAGYATFYLNVYNNDGNSPTKKSLLQATVETVDINKQNTINSTSNKKGAITTATAPKVQDDNATVSETSESNNKTTIVKNDNTAFPKLIFSNNNNSKKDNHTIPSKSTTSKKVVTSQQGKKRHEDAPIDMEDSKLTVFHQEVLSGMTLPVLSIDEFEQELLENSELPASLILVQRKKQSRRNSFTSGMRFGLGIYAGISKTTNDLSSDKVLGPELVDLRNNSEKQLETIHIGLSAILQTKQNVYLRSGLEYTRIASVFSKTVELVTQDSMEGIVEILINKFTNDTTFVYGQLAVTKKTEYNKKTYNYFHLIDVPLILGYNFGDEQWQIGVEAGIHANVYRKSKGEIPLLDSSFYDIGSDTEKWYKTNIGITPYMGFNATYNLSDYFQFHLSPGFKFKTLYSTKINPLKERLADLGIRGGVRYFF